MEKKIIEPQVLADSLNASYTDKETRELLFGVSEISFRNIRGAQPLLRIVLVGALFSYLYWKNFKSEIKDNQKTADYFKVEELCNSLFIENDLNLESATYLLFLIKKDLMNHSDSFFKPIMDNEKECEFGKIYGLLDEWHSSKERILVYYTNYDVLYFLKSITSCLAILREADVTIEKDIVYFDYRGKHINGEIYIKYDELSQCFLILLNKNNEYYDLRNLTKI